ncbi:MAG: hypothetical protein ACKVU2_05180 [Saprospiraceae bacterium]
MPNDFDRIFRENLDELLPFIANKLLGLDLSRTEVLADKVQVTLEREVDSFRKVRHDDPSLDYGVHWEFQSGDEDMRGRNLFYYGFFYQRYRLPLKQIVVYLGNEPPKLILKNVLELEGLCLKFQVVNLRDVPKETFLTSNIPEAAVACALPAP